MFDVILKGNKDSFVLILLNLETLDIFIFEVIVHSLCKFFDQIDQKLKPICIYFLQFVLQYLLICAHQFFIDKIHLCVA